MSDDQTILKNKACRDKKRKLYSDKKKLLKHEAYIINRHWGVNDMWLYYGNIKWIKAHYVT